MGISSDLLYIVVFHVFQQFYALTIDISEFLLFFGISVKYILYNVYYTTLHQQNTNIFPRNE